MHLITRGEQGKDYVPSKVCRMSPPWNHVKMKPTPFSPMDIPQ